MAKKRNYKKEYARDHASTKDKKARAKRNAANRKLKPGPGKEVDHKVPLSKGGGNGKSNLRVVTRAANRKKAAKRKITRTVKKKTTRRKR
jgi:5-methylcytosine-specific restriction endonuclease McrA